MSINDKAKVTGNEKNTRENMHMNEKNRTMVLGDKITKHEGSIMAVASREVVSMPPTTSIINAIRTMTEHGFRRIPIADAGTNRLEGMVTSVDIIDFLGGGKKNRFVEERHKGNLLSAINSPVREIMQHDVISIKDNAYIGDAIGIMLKHHTSGLPIIDNAGRIVAICTEKDLVIFLAGMHVNKSVYQYMSRDVKTTTGATTIGQAAKIMIENGFRRLPVVDDGRLIGIVTASDIMYYLGRGKAFEKLTTGNIHEALDEPVLTIVSRNIMKINPEKDIGEAARAMVDSNIGSLSVLEGNALIGIITERDFLKAITE